MKFTSLLVTLLCLGNLSSWAQEGYLKGKLNGEGAPLPFATVIVKLASDSSFIKAELTDDGGKFKIPGLKPNQYFIEATYVGLKTYSSEVFDFTAAGLTLPTITLESGPAELQEVEIVAEKRIVEVMADKTVFNVEQSLAATGSNGFDLLRKAPGVMIDNNDNVVVEGKAGVQIYINGKPSVLAGEDLNNFLRSLQSSDIEALEIITNPSSKFDAAGNAGIINIKLKREKGLGTNGTLNAGYAQNRFARFNGGASINHRTKKSNVFATYSHSQGRNESFLYLDRTQNGLRFDSRNDSERDADTHNLRAGYDWFPHRNHTFGVLANINLRDENAFSIARTPISLAGSDVAMQTLLANNDTRTNNENLGGNVNYRFADTLGHELGIDLDYGVYTRESNTNQPNQYINGANGSIISQQNYRMVAPIDIEIATAKLDYSQKLGKGVIAIGGKYSRVSTKNVFEFYNVTNDINVLDETRSNTFEYTENINAGYVNYSQNWKKLSMQLGLRAEETRSIGDLTSALAIDDQLVERQYLDWFPSGGFTYRPSQKRTWALTGSRRIQRPNYQNLNPFESRIDDLSLQKGNPFLQPQYINTIKLSHTYKYRLTTSISYSRVNDFFAQITDTIDVNSSFLISRNIADQEIFSATISYPTQITKWWSVYVSLTGSQSNYIANDPAFQPLEQFTFNGYAQNTFTLPKGYRFEVSGWFSSPSVWGGTFTTKSLGSLDVALQKKFMQDRLTVRLAGTDLFFTAPWRADIEYSALAITGTGGYGSRQFKVNLTYAFGHKDVKAIRKRSTGLEDEEKESQVI